MIGSRRIVEIVLYGAGEVRRFTQDTPILLDVWLAYFEQPAGGQSLLLEAWQDTPPFEVARVLRAASERIRKRIIYNGTLVEATLDVAELVSVVLPNTRWYVETVAEHDTAAGGARRPPRLPKAGELWDDLAARGGGRYPCPRLLPLIRMAGLLLWLGQDDTGERRRAAGDVFEAPDRIVTDERFAEAVLEGWKRLDGKLPDAPTPRADENRPGVIYSVSRNRPATIAQIHSVRTVKADAARRLFAVDCSRLTWAVIDCGIDAAHPAFLTGGGRKKGESLRAALRRSRVKHTYDFSFLRELLLGETEHLPASYTDTEDFKERLFAMLQRIERGQAIDWQTLLPILEVRHDAGYAKRKPTDGHGTHVAGVLAGDWKRSEDEHLLGVCPDLRLLDIRVCRPDGSSSEFVIISALQFLRWLNATGELMAVHGINMSLSLRHDAANYACGRTPVCVEAERAVSSGIVVVAAAGNLGYRRLLDDSSMPCEQFLPVSITDPGNAEAVITVGATHRLEPHTYGVSYFSSRGPTGDGRIKPDLVAPGEKILAPVLNEEATRLDGTSMAAPHVSGAAALLMGRHAELIGKPQRIKKILCDTATDLGREPYFQGRGLVDVLRAMQSV